ncbi:MAG: hypothetical protein E7231_00610 [Cellulosilyticum sp.]|nr:hypothetical protein [Cellulosilyticum sp.]
MKTEPLFWDRNQFVIVALNDNLIDSLYSTRPEVCIVIAPYSIYRVIASWNRNIKGNSQWQEEIAITSFEQIHDERQKENLNFLKTFYQSASIEMAYKVYTVWQVNRSLNNKLGNKIIDLFQTYEREIFNYFRYIECFK